MLQGKVNQCPQRPLKWSNSRGTNNPNDRSNLNCNFTTIIVGNVRRHQRAHERSSRHRSRDSTLSLILRVSEVAFVGLSPEDTGHRTDIETEQSSSDGREGANGIDVCDSHLDLNWPPLVLCVPVRRYSGACCGGKDGEEIQTPAGCMVLILCMCKICVPSPDGQVMHQHTRGTEKFHKTIPEIERAMISVPLG
jgi:hypothetical protein